MQQANDLWQHPVLSVDSRRVSAAVCCQGESFDHRDVLEDLLRRADAIGEIIGDNADKSADQACAPAGSVDAGVVGAEVGAQAGLSPVGAGGSVSPPSAAAAAVTDAAATAADAAAVMGGPSYPEAREGSHTIAGAAEGTALVRTCFYA